MIAPETTNEHNPPPPTRTRDIHHTAFPPLAVHDAHYVNVNLSARSSTTMATIRAVSYQMSVPLLKWDPALSRCRMIVLIKTRP